MEETHTFVERAPRRRSYKAAILSYTNATITQEVVVKNTSDGGALIQTSQNIMIPEHFILSVPVDGSKVECEVRWRKDNLLGVCFTSAPEHDSRNARMQSLETEYVLPSKFKLKRKALQ